MLKPDSYPENQQDELRLWQAFKKGDQEAFEQLYRRYFPVLVNYGSRLTTDAHQLEDAVQNLFIDLWRRSAHLGDVDNLKFYLLRALRNQVVRMSRNDIFDKSEPIDDFLDYLVSLSSEQQILEQDTLQTRVEQVRSAVGQLSPRQQEAINLRFHHGMSLDQIASLMDVSKQAVSNLLFKSYAVLRVTLRALSVWVFSTF